MSERHSTDPLAAVSYYRASTDHQEASVPQQREWARSASPRAGEELVREFSDEGIPGSEVESRPGLQGLIAFCEQRHKQRRPVRVLRVWDVDRLSRASSIRTAAVLDRLVCAGLTLIRTPDEEYDLEEDLDLVLLNLKQDLSKAAYAKAIGKNVLRGRQARARLGLWPGGPVPLGYRLGADGHLVVDPVWGPVIRWVYDRYAHTADSLADVCRRLNSDPSMPKPPSGEWAANYVRRILTHRVYLGAVVYGERHCGKYYHNRAGEHVRVKGNGGRAVVRVAEPGSAIVFEGAHEALVDPETFGAVARKLVANRWTREHHSGRRGEWVLSGLAHCGCCGRRMVGRTYRHKVRGEVRYTYRRLFCPGRSDCGADCDAGEAHQDVVLKELAALVKQEFGKPSRVERIGRKVERLLAEQEGEGARRKEALAAKLADLDAQLATATRRLLTIPDAEVAPFRAAYDTMKRERADLAADLDRTEHAREVSAKQARRMREALADLGRLEDVIAQRPPDLVRDLLARIVEKVTLHFAGPGPADSIGRRKRPLSHIDVTFRPEVAHLFIAGFNSAWNASATFKQCDLPIVLSANLGPRARAG
jgi:DNA invertase Pin-like site-specific DNA recombinase